MQNKYIVFEKVDIGTYINCIWTLVNKYMMNERFISWLDDWFNLKLKKTA